MPEQEKPFHLLLHDHLERGNWKVLSFALAVGCEERTVRNWTSGNRVPEEPFFVRIEKALFNEDQTAERAALRRAWEAALTQRGTPGRRPVARIAVPPGAVADERPIRYFGRERKDQVEELAALLVGAVTASVSVIVLGNGGIGKTTLKHEVAHHANVKARFQSRIFEARLEISPNVAAMQDAIVVAAGLDPRLDLDTLLDGLARPGPTLLLLDNLETPWDAEPKPTEELLRRLAAVPGLTLLASLRGRVAPLSPLWTRQLLLTPLEAAEARAMFRAHAPLIAEDDPHLVLFLDELGGNPLAIRLVAGRAAPHASLADLWADWQALGPNLASDVEAPQGHRHASLSNSIEFSLQSRRLDERGRRLFRMLGALPAGIAREDRVALLGVEEASAGTDQLLRLGLAHAAGDRLDMLPPIRRHAARHHAPEGEDAMGWARHLLALTAELQARFSMHGGEVVDRLRPELPNLEAALRRAVGEPQLRAAGISAVWTYTRVCASTGVGGSALRLLAEDCRSADDLGGEADCIKSLGEIALRRSDHDQARDCFEAAMPIYRQVGNLLGEADCIKSLGEIAFRRSDHDQACSRYDAALLLFRQVGSVLGQANCILSLGEIALRRSDHDRARKCFEEAMSLYQQVDDLRGQANCIKSFGQIALERFDHDQARKCFEAAKPLYRQAGYLLGEANCIKRLGQIALERSDHDQARECFEAAKPLYRQVVDLLGEANCIRSLGDIALACSDYAEARSRYEAALFLFRRVGEVMGEGITLFGLADIARDEGRIEEARSGYRQALAMQEQIGAAHNAAITRARLAALDK